MKNGREEPYFIKLMEIRVTKFKVGDRVRYKGDCSVFSGQLGGYEPAEGVVVEALGRDATNLRLTTPVERYPVGSVLGLFTRNLELIPSFTFADIQVGDKIRRTRKYESGALEVREGTVEDKVRNDYVVQANIILAYASDDGNKEVTLELLERPKLKHWAEEKPVGSIALHMVKKPGCDVRKRFLRQDNGAWQVLYFTDKSPEYYSAEELKDAFSAVDEAELDWVK